MISNNFFKIYKENKLKVKRIVKFAANPRKYTDA